MIAPKFEVNHQQTVCAARLQQHWLFSQVLSETYKNVVFYKVDVDQNSVSFGITLHAHIMCTYCQPGLH